MLPEFKSLINGLAENVSLTPVSIQDRHIAGTPWMSTTKHTNLGIKVYLPMVQNLEIKEILKNSTARLKRFFFFELPNLVMSMENIVYIDRCQTKPSGKNKKQKY